MEKNALTLLKIYGTEPPIFLIVADSIGPDFDADCAAYRYDEQMCPSDIIGVEQVLEDGDMDPHGIFEFVETVEKPDDWPFTGAVSWDRYRALFKSLPPAPPEERLPTGTIVRAA